MPNPIDHPLEFCHACWPHYPLYDKQREILESVRDNEETFVVAGNGLGKDFIAAMCALWWFGSRRPARVVTTSVKGDQLDDVLWGEIRRLYEESKIALPFQYNHLKIRQVYNDGTFVPRAELVGQVCDKNAALLGRHLERDIRRTLLIGDEASGIDTGVYTSSATWRHAALVIGNPFPCENFFRDGVRGGDIKSPTGTNLYRKVIRIRADDSPNIQLAFREIRAGLRRPEPLLIRSEERPWGIYDEAEFDRLEAAWNGRGDGPPLTTLVPGVIGLKEYLDRRTLWDPILQSISLDGLFYEGASVKLFPETWLDRAERLRPSGRRVPKTMGVDSAMGGDNTAWVIVDEQGIVFMLSMKTPDTTKITAQTIALIREYGLNPIDVLFDVGGGGQPHADRLRLQGYNVRTVGFGEAATPEKRHGLTPLDHRKHQAAIRYAYKNRRAEMYGLVRRMLDPAEGHEFGIAPQYMVVLRPQLKPLPLEYDDEGRMVLLPKNKRDPNSKKKTMIDLIGRSPDEADALALAVYGMMRKPMRSTAGAI